LVKPQLQVQAHQEQQTSKHIEHTISPSTPIKQEGATASKTKREQAQQAHREQRAQLAQMAQQAQQAQRA